LQVVGDERPSEGLRALWRRQLELDGDRDRRQHTTQHNTMTLRIVIALGPSGPTTFLERRYVPAPVTFFMLDFGLGLLAGLGGLNGRLARVA